MPENKKSASQNPQESSISGDPQLSSLERALQRQLYRFDCPAPDVLGEYYLRLLSGERMKSVKRHLAQCPRCQAELRDLARFMRSNSDDEACSE